jgi:Tol biopolymer transport system component/DNA-binding winged helix-turn-helix (wHTH) protein
MTDLIQPRVRFGPFEVDLNTHELRKTGIRVKLSGQPFLILAALLERPGQLVTREELRKHIWSEDTYVDFGHGLNAAVNKLREALCDSADDPRYIETLPRRGYRFIAAVEEVLEVTPVSISVPSPAALEPVWKSPLIEEEWEETVSFKRQILVHATSLVAVLFLLTVGAAHYWAEKSASRAFEKAEFREKQAAERALPPTELEQLESRAKEAAWKKISREGKESQPAAGPEKSKEVPEKPSPDDSFLLRLERSGQHIKLLEERSDSQGPSILRLDLAHVADPNSVTRIIDGHDAIAGPQPSPDGKKLVFTAGRNDSMEVWVCNADGSSARQLTNMGRAGTPRWSPDGRSIVFDSDGRYGRSGIYVVSADGGAVRAVVEDKSNNSVPSWSRDGNYIYFASNRGRTWNLDQLWKVPAQGGQPVQITLRGGFSAYESADGKTVYYAKHRYEHPDIWQVSVNGGEESRVSLLHPSTWASWALTDKGILLLSEYSGQKSELQYFDFATRSVHSLATLERASFWLASSANGSAVWYSELTDHQAQEVFKASLY